MDWAPVIGTKNPPLRSTRERTHLICHPNRQTVLHFLSLPLVGRVARSAGWGNVAARVDAPGWICTSSGWGTTPPVALAPPSPSRGGIKEISTLKKNCPALSFGERCTLPSRFAGEDLAIHPHFITI